MQKKRLIWLDWGKVFLIYLMIVGHSAPDKVSDTIICSFHMCAFFFLSGVLHKAPVNMIELSRLVGGIKKQGGVIRDSVENVKPLFKKLIIPVLFFNLVAYVCWFSYSGFMNELPSGVHELVIKPMLGIVLFGNSAHPMNGPCWFLVTLFFIKVIMTMLTEHRTMWYMIIGMALMAVIFDKIRFTGSDFMGRICFSFPFYCTGYLIKDYVLRFVEMKAIMRLLLLMVALTVLIAVSLYNTRGGILSYHFGKSIFLYYLTGFVGAFSVICLFSFLRKISLGIVTFISNGTLVILGIHIMLLSYVSIVRTGNAFLTAGICLLLTLPFIYLFNNYTPKMVGK